MHRKYLIMFDYVKYRNAWRYNLAPDCEQELSDSQYKALLKQGGLFVRNTYDFDCRQKTNFWNLIKDSFGGMEELSSNVRRKIHRANDAFDYKIIDKQIVRENGFPIIKATFKDYKVKDRTMNETVFNEYLDHCQKYNYDYWGVFDKETQDLVGFCAVHVFENSCEYGVIGFLPQYKHNASYPYYGFFYKMNEYYLGEKKFKYVTDGSRSITEHSNIQPFLEQNFKFRKAYCKLKIRYKWWFGIIVRVLLPFRNIIGNRNVKAVLNMHRYQSH